MFLFFVYIGEAFDSSRKQKPRNKRTNERKAKKIKRRQKKKNKRKAERTRKKNKLTKQTTAHAAELL